MPVPKGMKLPACGKRFLVPTSKQVRILSWLESNPGACIADVCMAIDGKKKKAGSAMYVTIRRMIRRGFLRTGYGKGTRYKLFPVWQSPTRN